MGLLSDTRRQLASLWQRDNRPVHFLTSFNEVLFEASGRECVRSFRKANGNSYNLVAYVETEATEALQPLQRELASHQVETVNLAELPLLKQFLDLAGDVIPQDLGGSAPPEMFPGEGPSSGDVWFRKHMFRWFRKLVALDHAVSRYEGILIWMDCDCVSKAPLPRSVVERAFNGAGVFHMCGDRKYTETGLVGYDLDKPGVRHLIREMTLHYMERRFENLHRWDDCITFDHVRAQQGGPVCRDIGGRKVGHGDILCTTLLAPYLDHDKGRHSRKLGLVR